MALLENEVNALSETASFFDGGFVTCEALDEVSRKASISFRLPCVLFQTVSPILLGMGPLDLFQISEPMQVWIPRLSQERLVPTAEEILPNASNQLNLAVSASTKSTVDLFNKLSVIVRDPSDLIPMLPLGIYISVRCRCDVDGIILALEKLQKLPIDGVFEIQWALSSVYGWILAEMGSVKNLSLLTHSNV
jgi:hypothetical protein